MSRKVRTTLLLLRVISCVVLLALVITAMVIIKKKPEMFTSDCITEFVSSNRLVALLEFVMLYVLKGASFIFPVAVLNIAAAAVFGLPYSFLVSTTGILCEFLSIFYIGRFLGSEVVAWLKKKYPKLETIENINSSNGILISFILRIIGLVSFDIGSLYLGAVRISVNEFLIGSMAGALINIILSNLFGKYMFDPLCWQLWAIVITRIIIVLIIVYIKYRMDRSRNGV